MRKHLAKILFTLFMVIGLSISVSAQKDKKKPKPKRKPPKIIVKKPKKPKKKKPNSYSKFIRVKAPSDIS